MRIASLLQFVCILFSTCAFAQYTVELQPMKYSGKNSFYISDVQDRRKDPSTIGLVHVGMGNRKKPANFNKAFQEFVKDYLNAAVVTNARPVPVTINVYQFYINEKTLAFSETGSIEATFEATTTYREQKVVLFKKDFYYEEQGMDVTKKHPENIYLIFRKLLSAIDSSLTQLNEANTPLIIADSIPAAAPAKTTETLKSSSEPARTPSLNSKKENYGGLVTLGAAIGGGGIIGMPLRIYPTRKIAIELGPYFRPFFLRVDGNRSTIYPALMTAGGFVFYFKEELDFSNKLKLQGLSIKGGYSVGTFPETFGALSYASEKIGLDGRSFSTEVGLGALVLLSEEPGIYYPLTNDIVQPFLYFKFHWSWVVSKSKKRGI